ncbi:MAG: DNA internalization-related competence protein ComEC/Rec2 [Armatimonadota bacterium]
MPSTDTTDDAVTPQASGFLTTIRSRPLVLIALSLAGGIIWADWTAPPPLIVTLIAVSAAAVMVASIAFRSRATMVLICLTAALTGGALHAHRIYQGPADPATLHHAHVDRMSGYVERLVYRKHFGQKVQLSATAASYDGHVVHLAGKTVIRLPPEPAVNPGDELVLEDVMVWRPASVTSPGQFDSRRHLARQGIHSLGRAETIHAIGRHPSLAVPLGALVAQVREHVVSVLTTAMPGPDSDFYGNLLAGMVFGMYNVELPEDTVEAFRRSGTVHLMVVSGAHVSLVLAAIAFVAFGFRVRPPMWIILVVLPPLVMYAMIAGLRASVVRSLAMSALVVLAAVSGRRYDVWTGLGVAAIVLCLVDTSAPFSVGVQMTFAAVIGVVAFIRTRRRDDQPVSRLKRNADMLVRGSLGAWLAVTPLVAYHFDLLVLLGAGANVLAIPLRTFLLYLGFTAVLLGSIWTPIAVIPAAIGRAVLYLTLEVVRFFAHLPYAAIDNFHLPVTACIAWYGAVIVLWYLMKPSPAPESQASITGATWAWTSAFAVSALVFFIVVLQPADSPNLRMSFLTVGQGQCALITDDAGSSVMIDAGTGLSSPSQYRHVGRRIILPYLAARGIRQLDALIMTHGDRDHCSGIPAIIRKIDVTHLLTNGLPVDPPTPAGRALWAAQECGVDCRSLRAGATLTMAGGAKLEILHPGKSPVQTGDMDNNNSIVARLTYGDVSILFAGDIQSDAEEELIARARRLGMPLQSTVLVLPHHGRKTSTTDDLLDAVRPQLAVVSGASPRYTPAHPEVLQRLNERGIPLISTDVIGTIEIITDGSRLWISDYRYYCSPEYASGRVKADIRQLWARVADGEFGGPGIPPTLAAAISWSTNCLNKDRACSDAVRRAGV